MPISLCIDARIADRARADAVPGRAGFARRDPACCAAAAGLAVYGAGLEAGEVEGLDVVVEAVDGVGAAFLFEAGGEATCVGWKKISLCIHR